jgi:hypothetical protein
VPRKTCIPSRFHLQYFNSGAAGCGQQAAIQGEKRAAMLLGTDDYICVISIEAEMLS